MTQDNTPQFPHREPSPLIDGSTRELAIELVDELLCLEQKTHPRNSMVDGRVTGAMAEKDENSRQALMTANDLVEMLAGWAINHQIGLVLNGMPGGVVVLNDGSYSEEQRKADNHIHEAAAAGYDFSDTKTNRRILTALLHHGPGPFPISIVIEATDALAALEMGEVQPFVKHMRGPGQDLQGYTEWKLRYWAVLHLSYLLGMREKRDEAKDEVAKAYGIKPDTIDKWAGLLPEKLVNHPINEMKILARRAGETTRKIRTRGASSNQDNHLLKRLDHKWGKTALAHNGDAYKQILQPKGTVVPFPS